MALAEIEFELTAQQFALMDYPRLAQGQSLDLQLETGVLLPEPGAEAWFTVQKEPLAQRFVQVMRAQYAFTGPIREAEIADEEEVQTAHLLVQCGDIPLRVTCGPHEDG